MSIELFITRFILVVILMMAVFVSYFRGNGKWTNPLFVYVLSTTIIYLFYALGGAEFTNGTSISGEAYYVINLLLSTFAYTFAVRGMDKELKSRSLIDHKFLSRILWMLLAPTAISLTILLFKLTNGNLFLLFDLTSGNAMKWLRITERDPLVYITEAIFLALVSIMIPAALLSLGQGKKLFVVVSFVSYFLYLLSTGSRSPAIALILMIIVPAMELKKRGHNNRWVQRLLRSSAIIIAILFIAVSLSRDKIEDNSDEMLKAVFSADELGYIANSSFIPYGIQLPSTIISIYFASTFNNYLIAFDQSDVMEKSMGYRLFYTQYKSLDLLFPNGEKEKETILSDNTGHLRSISPTGDQWATNLGTLVLEFGRLYSLIASIIQGLIMGWLMRLARRLESNRRVILLSFIFPLAISSALVHPLMSFSVHIQLFVILLMIVMWLRGPRSHVQSPVKLSFHAE